MAIETQCPKCRKRYRVKDELAGRKIKCKQCGGPIKVEVPQAVPDDEWGDEGYDEEIPAAAPPPPRRKKGTGKKPAKKSAGKARSSSKPVWHLPVGILGLIAGFGLLAFSIYGIINGMRKSFRALGGAVFLIAGSYNLAFGNSEE